MVAMACHVASGIESTTTRTDPSAIATFTPPECRLRGEAQTLPLARFCTHFMFAGPVNDPGQPPITSVPGEFGGNFAVKLFPPIPGQIHTPRPSCSDEVPRISLSSMVLEVPSVMARIFTPLP